MAMVNDSRQGHAAKQNIVSSTHLKDHNGTTAAHNIVHNRPNRPCHEAIKIRSPGTLSLSLSTGATTLASTAPSNRGSHLMSGRPNGEGSLLWRWRLRCSCWLLVVWITSIGSITIHVRVLGLCIPLSISLVPLSISSIVTTSSTGSSTCTPLGGFLRLSLFVRRASSP